MTKLSGKERVVPYSKCQLVDTGAETAQNISIRPSSQSRVIQARKYQWMLTQEGTVRGGMRCSHASKYLSGKY